MEAILLKPERPAGFARSVRDANGNILRRLEFTHREPQWLDGDDLKAVQGDIGSALCYAELGPNGDPLGKPAKLQEPGGLERLEPKEPTVSGANGDPSQNGHGEAKGKRKRE